MTPLGDGLVELVAQMERNAASKLAERAQMAGRTTEEQESIERQEWASKRHGFEMRKEWDRRRQALDLSRAPITNHDRDLIVSGDYENSHCVRTALKFINQSKLTFFVMCGPNGVGKTFAAAVAASRVTSARFVRARRLPDVMRPRYHERDQALDPRAVKLVVIEELGLEDPSDQRWLDAWFELVDDRQGYGHTIITTNLTKKQFNTRYDKRIMDRLGRVCHVHQMTGESRRKAKK